MTHQLKHTIVGIILVTLMFTLLIILLIVCQPVPPVINDRAPAIERLEEI